jgi:hypothetical protein
LNIDIGAVMEQTLKRKLLAAISMLFEMDAFLLENASYEPSITAKLSSYLANQFSPEWHVDHEYNRDIHQKDLVKRNILSGREMLPDIIIHKRGELGLENNLMVIELKKDSGPNSEDKKKLRFMTSSDCPYQYQYGLHINLGVNKLNAGKIYRHGREIGELEDEEVV